MNCTEYQKAAVFLLSLPIGLAAEVAGHLDSFKLRRLQEAAMDLPEVDTQTRSTILRELQEGVPTPLAKLASERPFILARRLESMWLGGSQLRLELGAGLLEAVQGKSGRYSYLRSLKSKAVWWHVDGPHHNDELADDAYRFLSDGELVEEGQLSNDGYQVLDPDGPLEYGGCRYREATEDEVAPEDSWRGLGLNPAGILSWHTRVLSDKQETSYTPASPTLVYDFLSTAKERTTRRTPNLDWAKEVRSADEWEEPSLALILEDSTQAIGYYRAALLIYCVPVHQSFRYAIFEKLTAEESRGVLRSLTRLEEDSKSYETLSYQLALLGVGPTLDLADTVSAVARGERLPVSPHRWRAIILRVLDKARRAQLLEAVLDRLTENEQLELMVAYSAPGLRRDYRKISDFVISNFVAQTIKPGPSTRIDCQRLIMKNPLEAALAFNRLLSGSWVDTRLHRWARRNPEEAARQIASARPGKLLSGPALSSALVSQLETGVKDSLKSYLTALGVTLNESETEAKAEGPRVLAVYHSILREQHDGDGRYQLSSG